MSCGENGFSGIHHIGFVVDDLDSSIEKLEGAQAQRIEIFWGLLFVGGKVNYTRTGATCQPVDR